MARAVLLTADVPFGTGGFGGPQIPFFSCPDGQTLAFWLGGEDGQDYAPANAINLVPDGQGGFGASVTIVPGQAFEFDCYRDSLGGVCGVGSFEGQNFTIYGISTTAVTSGAANVAVTLCCDTPDIPPAYAMTPAALSANGVPEPAGTDIGFGETVYFTLDFTADEWDGMTPVSLGGAASRPSGSSTSQPALNTTPDISSWTDFRDQLLTQLTGTNSFSSWESINSQSPPEIEISFPMPDGTTFNTTIPLQLPGYLSPVSSSLALFQADVRAICEVFVFCGFIWTVIKLLSKW